MLSSLLLENVMALEIEGWCMAATEPAGENEQPETYDAVTWFEANNADTQSLLLGRHDEGQTLEEEEVHDGSPVRARRHFVPQEVIELPETMEREAAIDWVEENRDHEQFEGYDWEEHDRKGLLAVIVNNRNNYRSTLSYFEQQLQDVHAVGIEAQQKLDEIRGEMADAMLNGPAVSVNCVEEPEGDD